ncbi:MAG: helix-turn-helix transcriptional regulator, partial [Pseudomonas sp.]
MRTIDIASIRTQTNNQRQLDLLDEHDWSSKRPTPEPRHNGSYLTNNLRLQRSLRAMTQQELAAKVNVSRQTISRIERSHG